MESLARKGLRDRRNRVLDNYGWTEDRRIWISYRLSRGMINNGVIGIPGDNEAIPTGRLCLWAVKLGSRVGTVVCKENQAWGFGPFFRRRGGEQGDCLLLVFDLKTRGAQVSVGDETLTENRVADESRIEAPN